MKSPEDGAEDSTTDESREAALRAYMIALGERLRRRRQACALTQHDLSVKTAVAKDMISRVENGHYQSPGLRTLLRLADGLETPLPSLLPPTPGLPPDGDAAQRRRLLELIGRADPETLELLVGVAEVIVGRRAPPPPTTPRGPR